MNEHDEWPIHSIPTCQRADDRYVEDTEEMLIEGTWPDEDVRKADQGKIPMTMHPLQPLPLVLPSNQLACVQLKMTVQLASTNFIDIIVKGTILVLETLLQQC